MFHRHWNDQAQGIRSQRIKEKKASSLYFVIQLPRLSHKHIVQDSQKRHTSKESEHDKDAQRMIFQLLLKMINEQMPRFYIASRTIMNWKWFGDDDDLVLLVFVCATSTGNSSCDFSLTEGTTEY